ncbi:hypothetical protein Back11_38860 [Paenibacillus baekrokdamisoli]|uniref:Uncharacterized protein n=2 Tax=Paenibacillus baekrokdamisoli TaxID=1712516 RepID=A0A3G9J9L4_9BACL|nr:response regulator [Paenibacillus baekrokdamisoli]MBB3068413.1 two-component system response regulator YesN [Paenibacillus baekrokdamisoli]BBH22541.1 hypothetical protein Back11_38860 [Paenibacillus baekrokdamisoli]
MYRVLLVDDEPLVLEGLRLMVDWKSHGFAICGEACDGEDAFELIKQLNPDLVVTDVCMPIIDGLQLIEKCAATRQCALFVILSGHDDFSYAHKALQYSVRNYWLKPIDTDEIHLTLSELRNEWEAERKEAEYGTQHEQEGDSLKEEEALLFAIENNDVDRIETAAKRLYWHMKRTAPEAGLRSFVANMILDLIRRISEQETFEEMGERVFLHSSMFADSSEDSWLVDLTALCKEAATNLAQRRLKEGVAGEAARYVRHHFRKPLKLKQVAQELYIQPAYLGQLFKKTVGMSFLDYVHSIRIAEAQKLLRRTDLKVANVARSVGYVDPELFASKFKQFTNTLPSQYKKAD